MKKYIVTLTNLQKSATHFEVAIMAWSHSENDGFVLYDENQNEIAKYRNGYIAGWRIESKEGSGKEVLA